VVVAAGSVAVCRLQKPKISRWGRQNGTSPRWMVFRGPFALGHTEAIMTMPEASGKGVSPENDKPTESVRLVCSASIRLERHYPRQKVPGSVNPNQGRSSFLGWLHFAVLKTGCRPGLLPVEVE